MNKRPVLLERLFVTALQHYHYEAMRSQLEDGLSLVLTREPDNQFDDKAVSVHMRNHEQTKIGFIARQNNAVVANLMDAGYELQLIVVEHNVGNPLKFRLECDLFAMLYPPSELDALEEPASYTPPSYI